MRIKGSFAAEAALGLMAVMFLCMYGANLTRIYVKEEKTEVLWNYDEEEIPCEIWCFDESLYGE